MTRRSLRNDPLAARGRAGPQPHETTGSHLHPRRHPQRQDDSGLPVAGPDAGEAVAGHGGERGRHGERPSKSQLKREMTALQALGEQLLTLTPAKLRGLPIPKELVEAVELAQRIQSSREGLRRQRQYIGRLMREIDAQPLRDALAVDGAAHRAAVAAMHAAEHWRERLLADPQALAELVERNPACTALADAIARLVDDARAELARSQPGRRYRELFRTLRDALAGATRPQGGPA